LADFCLWAVVKGVGGDRRRQQQTTMRNHSKRLKIAKSSKGKAKITSRPRTSKATKATPFPTAHKQKSANASNFELLIQKFSSI